MSTAELKKKVLKKIEQIDKDYLLEDLLNLIEIESLHEEVYEIPESHMKSINIGLKQMERGEVESHAKVQKEIKKWLSE